MIQPSASHPATLHPSVDRTVPPSGSGVCANRSCRQVMKYAPPFRAFVYLWVVTLSCGARLGRSQQSPSPDESSVPEAAEGADARLRFSQSLAQSEATSHLGNAQLSMRAGLLRGQGGDFAGAVKEFQKALDVKPDFPEAHYNLGLALLANSGSVPAWRCGRTTPRPGEWLAWPFSNPTTQPKQSQS